MLLLEAVVFFSFNLLHRFAGSSGIHTFFCKDRAAGSNLQKLKDSTGNSDTLYLIIKLNSDDLISFDHASKVCKQCHDAQVISHQDASKLPRTLLPAWINLTAHRFQSGDRHNFTWSENANLGNLTSDDIVWALWLPSSTSKYALLATAPSNATRIRYLGLPQDELYYSSAGRQALIGTLMPRSIICQRPIRKSCHYRSIEGQRCIFHPKFGCHTYINFTSQPPDDPDNGTVCSKFRRTVKRCPLNKCSCSVTSWNEWSLCNEMYCTTHPRNRTRQRRIVEPCPIGWVHEILNQTEPCPLPEDCQILANNFTMNDSLRHNF